MIEKDNGVSQQTLVSNGSENTVSVAKRKPQYIAGIAATLGALAAGLVLGWTSSAGKDGIYLAEQYNISITPDEFSWIGSYATLGAAAICVPIGIISDLIGCRNAMLCLVLPFIIGWALIIWSNSILMFYVGRFITGLSGGAFCVTAPMYTSEIAETAIRGSLGSYFQLMLSAGILIAYILSATVKNIYWITLISATVPIIFFCVFFFMPNTPIYYLKKGNENAARANLIRLRGLEFNVDNELHKNRESLAEIQKNRVPLLVAFSSKVAVKGLLIGFGLMFFQQLSGINAIIFYVGNIFSDTDIPPGISSIAIGLMQVVAVFISTLVVDKLGRRVLLLSSGVAMCLSTLILGIYFYLYKQGIHSLNWLPLLSVCVFVVIFSLGFGPIPWMMMGEIFSPQIKSIASSIACLFNWLMAFLVTKFFSNLVSSFGNDITFWIFSAICALGIIFIFLTVPETKGRTLDQIQIELGGIPMTEQPCRKA